MEIRRRAFGWNGATRHLSLRCPRTPRGDSIRAGPSEAQRSANKGPRARRGRRRRDGDPKAQRRALGWGGAGGIQLRIRSAPSSRTGAPGTRCWRAGVGERSLRRLSPRLLRNCRRMVAWLTARTPERGERRAERGGGQAGGAASTDVREQARLPDNEATRRLSPRLLRNRRRMVAWLTARTPERGERRAERGRRLGGAGGIQLRIRSAPSSRERSPATPIATPTWRFARLVRGLLH